MLLGIAGLVDGDWNNIDSSVLKNAKNMGFKTLQIRVSDTETITQKIYIESDLCIRTLALKCLKLLEIMVEGL